MLEIDVNGEPVLVDVVFHDSGEEPEKACVNRMVSAKVGDATFHCPGEDWKPAVEWAVGQMKASAFLPVAGASLVFDNEKSMSPAAPIGGFRSKRLITVVITQYAKAFSIDWSAHESVLSRATALGFADGLLGNGPTAAASADEAPAAKPTVEEIKPVVRSWYAQGSQRANGLFNVMLKDGNCEQHFAEKALGQALTVGDPEAIRLAEMLVSIGQDEREQLCQTWHVAN